MSLPFFLLFSSSSRLILASTPPPDNLATRSFFNPNAEARKQPSVEYWTSSTACPYFANIEGDALWEKTIPSALSLTNIVEQKSAVRDHNFCFEACTRQFSFNILTGASSPPIHNDSAVLSKCGKCTPLLGNVTNNNTTLFGYIGKEDHTGFVFLAMPEPATLVLTLIANKTGHFCLIPYTVTRGTIFGKYPPPPPNILAIFVDNWLCSHSNDCISKDTDTIMHHMFREQLAFGLAFYNDVGGQSKFLLPPFYDGYSNIPTERHCSDPVEQINLDPFDPQNMDDVKNWFDAAMTTCFKVLAGGASKDQRRASYVELFLPGIIDTSVRVKGGGHPGSTSIIDIIDSQLKNLLRQLTFSVSVVIGARKMIRADLPKWESDAISSQVVLAAWSSNWKKDEACFVFRTMTSVSDVLGNITYGTGLSLCKMDEKNVNGYVGLGDGLMYLNDGGATTGAASWYGVITTRDVATSNNIATGTFCHKEYGVATVALSWTQEKSLYNYATNKVSMRGQPLKQDWRFSMTEPTDPVLRDMCVKSRPSGAPINGMPAHTTIKPTSSPPTPPLWDENEATLSTTSPTPSSIDFQQEKEGEEESNDDDNMTTSGFWKGLLGLGVVFMCLCVCVVYRRCISRGGGGFKDADSDATTTTTTDSRQVIEMSRHNGVANGEDGEEGSLLERGSNTVTAASPSPPVTVVPRRQKMWDEMADITAYEEAPILRDGKEFERVWNAAHIVDVWGATLAKAPLGNDLTPYMSRLRFKSVASGIVAANQVEKQYFFGRALGVHKIIPGHMVMVEVTWISFPMWCLKVLR